MLEYIIGEYQQKPGEVVLQQFRPIPTTHTNKDMVFVLIAEESKLNANAIEFMKESSLHFKVLSNDKKAMKGQRRSKKLLINGDEVSANPFDLVKDILSIADRDYLLAYLKNNKPNLYVAVQYLSCNMDKLCEANRNAIQWLDLNLFKCQQDMLYAFIAKFMKVEPGRPFLKWKYPKKEKEDA